MPTIKNYGIAAVSNDVQLGKRGGRFIFDSASGTFKLTGSDGATVSRVKIADATELDDAVSLSQLNAVSTAASNAQTAADDAQAELDATQVGAGLDTDGSYIAPSGSNYIDGAASLANADELLDAQIKVVADANGATQTELDATQTGAGLGSDGSYVAPTGSNYLDTATSLANADELLDAAIDALQSEVDTTQSSVGLDRDGLYVTEETSNYLKASDFANAAYDENLRNADLLLDAKIKEVADSVTGDAAAIQSELDTTQSSIGLNGDGTYTAPAGALLSGSTSIINGMEALETQILANDGDIGDLSTLTTTAQGSLVDAINEIDANYDALGTMAQQDSNSVAITGGAIDGVVIGATTAANGTFADVVIQGNLTVNGTTTTMDVENMSIADNIIELNSGETGAGITAGTSGLDVERGTEQNTQWVFDDSVDAWVAKYSDNSKANIDGVFVGTINSIVDRQYGGLGTDISGYAASSLLFADGSELAEGATDQVLTVTGAGTVEYAYVQELRTASGDLVFDQGAVNGTGGEKIEFATEDNAVYLTARNAAGTGDVDLYLSGQGNGDVIISQNASQQGLIIAEDDTTLTVSGGNASAADAGDAVLKGGDGTGSFASGDVILQGGTGGASEGITIIKDSAGNEVATFEGVASATDHVTVKNGLGEARIEGAGDSADVNLVLAPKGNGLVVVPAGYDISAAGDEALANKGYVDAQVQQVANNVDPLVMRAAIAADSTNDTFNIGTMSNVAGKTYYVSRVTLHVTTDFTGGSVDHMVVSDGTTELAAEVDSDIVAGTYIVDLPFAVATAGGASIDLSFKQSDGTTAAVPTAGDMVAVVEYKVL